MKIIITKDSHGFLAELEGYENVFAHGATPEEAKKELLGVLDMTTKFKSTI
ncbi:hypothetical protein MK079_02590 [Candidatus Gracilibacteria bacterium]|nr:hypothetical protein [Candidatus Gracilibacteria bacterium]